MTEIWDLYTRDENGNFHKLDQKGVRGERLPYNTYHMVVMVWLRNSRGEFLISRRSSAKSYPLCWEPTGGSALAGESSVEAACQEVREELGITLDPTRGKHVARAPRAYDGCDDFVDVWLFDDVEVAIEEVVVQQEEVSEAMWGRKKSGLLWKLAVGSPGRNTILLKQYSAGR